MMQSRVKKTQSESSWASIVARGGASNGYSSPSPTPSTSIAMISGTEGTALSPSNSVCLSSSSNISVSDYTQSPNTNAIFTNDMEGEKETKLIHHSNESNESMMKTPMSDANPLQIVPCTSTNNPMTVMGQSQGQLQQLQQQANEGTPTLAVGGYTLDEYNVMLRNELQLRQWHSGNLRQTIERNRANYKSVEQGLLSMNLSHKKWYESALEQLYPKETTEHGDVHKEIRKMLESAPKKDSESMKRLEKQLVESRKRLKPLDSFGARQQKIEHFLAAFRQKETRQILSLQEAQSMNVLTSINEVEMEKVNDMQLRWELQEMAELYHKRLSSLRSEVRWWRKRYELLKTHFSNEHVNF